MFHWILDKENNLYPLLPRLSEAQIHLPPDLYNLIMNSEGDLALRVGEIKPLPQIYGTQILQKASKIWTTWEKKGFHSMGVLLSGLRGSGKTLVVKILMHRALEEEIPVIVIEKAFRGASLIDFFSRFNGQPFLAVIDEFEKKYDDEEGDQDSFLCFLQGTSDYNALTLLTANEPDLISEYMISRPGRIRYHLKFKGLDPDSIRGYIQANLSEDNLHKGDEILAYLKSFGSVSFDMLEALVEEINLYPGVSDVREVAEDLNIEAGTTSYQVTLYDLEENPLPHVSSGVVSLDLSNVIYSSDTPDDYDPTTLIFYYQGLPTVNQADFDELKQIFPDILDAYRQGDGGVYEPRQTLRTIERRGYHLYPLEKDLFIRMDSTDGSSWYYLRSFGEKRAGIPPVWKVRLTPIHTN